MWVHHAGNGGPISVPIPVPVLMLPHLHVVHHHLVGQVASVLCLIHLLVQQGLWGRIRLWECWGWADTSNSPKPTLAPQHILMPVNSFPILWPPPLVLKEWGPHTHIPPSPFLCAVAELGPHLVCDPLQVEDPPAHTWAMLMPQ